MTKELLDPLADHPMIWGLITRSGQQHKYTTQYLGVRGVKQVEQGKFRNHGKYGLKPVGDNWELFNVFEFMYIHQYDYYFCLIIL